LGLSGKPSRRLSPHHTQLLEFVSAQNTMDLFKSLMVLSKIAANAVQNAAHFAVFTGWRSKTSVLNNSSVYSNM
jgi:hypothetical protein